MCVAVQLLGVANTPLKVTVLEPWAAPKFTPEMVTEVPTGPDVGDKELTMGAVSTVKGNALDIRPETVTMTLPVEVPLGTGTMIRVSLQELGLASTPLKVIVLVPCVAPK
jgi:hypothetical protein